MFLEGRAPASLASQSSALPSSRAQVEGSRHESFKVTQRDPSTVARDDVLDKGRRSFFIVSLVKNG
jgi:hypothetical protein